MALPGLVSNGISPVFDETTGVTICSLWKGTKARYDEMSTDAKLTQESFAVAELLRSYYGANRLTMKEAALQLRVLLETLQSSVGGRRKAYDAFVQSGINKDGEYVISIEKLAAMMASKGLKPINPEDIDRGQRQDYWQLVEEYWKAQGLQGGKVARRDFTPVTLPLPQSNPTAPGAGGTDVTLPSPQELAGVQTDKGRVEIPDGGLNSAIGRVQGKGAQMPQGASKHRFGPAVAAGTSIEWVRAEMPPENNVEEPDFEFWEARLPEPRPK